MFKSHTVSFKSKYSMNETIKRTMEIILCPSNNFKLVKASYSGIQKIIFNTNRDSIIFRNSFSPIVNIEISEVKTETLLSISFELRGITKGILAVFLIQDILFSLDLFILSLNKPYINIAICILPLTLALCFGMIGFLIFRISSKKILDVLSEKLNKRNE